MHVVSSTLLLAMSWDTQLTRWIVWVGLVVLTVALLVLIRTRWGQSQPLSKCIVLSLLAHLLLGIYTTTVTIVTSPIGSPDGEGIQVALASGGNEANVLDPATDPAPWDALGTAVGDTALPDLELGPAAALTALPESHELERQLPAELPAITAPIPTPAGEDAGPPTPAPGPDPIAEARMARPEPVELPVERDSLDSIPPPEQPPPASAGAGAPSSDKTSTAGSSSNTKDDNKSSGSPRGDKDRSGDQKPLAGAAGSGTGKGGLPGVLHERLGDHVSKGRGATHQTEAAVKSALVWLAANQRPSGRWESRGLGGGGRAADGEERQGAGLQADAGLTGLALLAYLAAGHTHLQGPHQPTVRRGLEYLLGIQDSDGCLAATTHRYERMYCHAMATCALSEALAMTGDRRLQPAVERAIGYTLRSQDRATGGWRYMPGDPGDTSQLGWQLMALKSAELGGIPIPQATRDGVARFLSSVSAGRHRGLASYQPNRPIATRSMTAEAMVCRQFLGVVDSAEALSEARGFLLEELPGSGRTNHYYWYYATLGLHQTQGDAWQRWNEALQQNLLATQRHDTSLAGSWDPDPVWGPCGGRVYSTSLATLCLEVYYRFLPLYVEAAGRERRTK